MFSSKTTDHLGFVSRQLASLTKTEPMDSALRRLRESCPAVYNKDIDRLQSLLLGPPLADDSLAATPYATLGKLMPAQNTSKAKFFSNFVSYVQQSKVLFETYWASALSMIWYLLSICAVAIVVALMYSLYVLPSFSQMFGQFGSQLPVVTELLFRPGGKAFPLLALALVLLIGLIAWFAVSFHKRIQKLEPLPRWPAWIPFVGALAEAYNTTLFLNFTRILVESDVETGRAIADAAALTNYEHVSMESLRSGNPGASDRSVFMELGIASKLGRFREELQFQCDQQIGRLTLALVEARDRFAISLKIVLYVFVAALVVAMYLPIFKMGSII